MRLKNQTLYPEKMSRMKKSIFFIFALGFFVVSCSNPGDPEKVLARARKYFRQGNYEKALQDHIWFHDNALKYKPSLYGIRLSFALLDWIELGREYPKAHNELVDIRNRKSELIKNKRGSRELFHDVKSINRYLDERQRTVDLFKKMIECDFQLAKRCYRLAKDDLIAFKEFEICNRMMEAPMFIVRDMRKTLEQNIGFYKNSQWADETHLEWSIKYYLEEAEHTVVVLTKNNRFVEAERFLKKASEDIDIVRITSGLNDLKIKYMKSRATAG